MKHYELSMEFWKGSYFLGSAYTYAYDIKTVIECYKRESTYYGEDNLVGWSIKCLEESST